MFYGNSYSDLLTADKAVLFILDRPSYSVYTRDDNLYFNYIYSEFLDSFDLAIANDMKKIATSCVARLSFDLLDRGYKLFVVKNKKVLELKPGKIEACSKYIKKEHNILKLFLGGAFDDFWSN